MKIAHIIWFVSLCIFSFWIGLFLDSTSSPNTLSVDQKSPAQSENSYESQNKGSIDKKLDAHKKNFTTVIGQDGIPIVSSEVSNILSDTSHEWRLGNQDGFNVFIKNIQTSFNPVTRKISVSYTLENLDERSLDAIIENFVLLIPHEKKWYPPYAFEPQKSDIFSLTGKTEIKREFVYNVRPGIVGEGASMSIEVYMKSGDLITFMDGPKFDITGTSRFLAVKNLRLINSLKEPYLVGEWPTIYSDREPKNLILEYRIVNENNIAFTVTPALRIHHFSENNPILKEEKWKTLTLKKGESEILTFPLPTMDYKPWVYLGKFLLLDNNGTHLWPDIPVRWIVGGDVARIINTVVEQKEPTSMNIDIEYTGTPPDIQARPENSSRTEKSVSMVLEFQDALGTSLSETLSKKIPIYIGQRSAHMSFEVNGINIPNDSFVKVSIIDNQTVLDEKTFSLQGSLLVREAPQNIVLEEVTLWQNNTSIPWTKALSAFLLLFLLFLWIRKLIGKHYHFLIVLFFSLGIFFSHDSEAFVAGCNLANVTVTWPSPSNTFLCGQTYTFTGGWWMNACANTDASMTVAGNLVQYHNWLNCISARCEYNTRYAGSFAVDRTMPAGFRGRHVISVPWSKSQWDCSASWTETYAVNVSCPENGVCGSIHGSSQLWPTSGSWCDVGAMSGWTQVGDISNNNAWWWNCYGIDGGATASCYFVQQCPVGFILNSWACRLARCDNNPSVDLSFATPVSLYELPTTMPYTFTRDYFTTLVTNGVDTGEKCEYTCVNGYRADFTGSIKRCVPISCSGLIASNGIECSWDSINLSGNLDITRVRRANTWGCTGPQKCEWHCPSDKPFYCVTKNACVVNNDDCGCPSGQKMCGNGQCIAGNLTCPSTAPAQCNNDGVCSGMESCDCSDCTNGDTDDTDHCKNGLRCTRDSSDSTCSEAACCPAGMSWSCENNTCVNTCWTHVPSELKAWIDIPYITCDAKSGATHFRYQVRSGSLTYTSDSYVTGTTIRHIWPLMDTWSYSVQCLYGTANSPASDMVPDLCSKTILVRPSTDMVQGCSTIHAYKGTTISTSLINDVAFDASFSCGSRWDASGESLPYRLTIGFQEPIYLQSDSFNILGIGFVSVPTTRYTFNNAVDVTCAVKVGDGYSTNNNCRIRTCVGTDCSAPQTFVVTPSQNAQCTSSESATYDIGCNDASGDYARCADWFLRANNETTLKVNNQIKKLTCSSTLPPWALSPVKTCTIPLPSWGDPVTLFSGDANSFQTTLYSLTRDQIPPTGSVEYFTNYSAGTKLQPSQYSYWQKQPITAVVTCNDRPGSSDGSGCACASTLQESGTELWSPGKPHSNPKTGPDVMTYTRVFSQWYSVTSVSVRDTAGLVSSPMSVAIGVDSVAPKVQINIPTTGGSFSMTVQDPAEWWSGLWKPGSLRPLPAGVLRFPTAPSVLYKTFSKAAYIANPSLFEFDDNCSMPAADNADYYMIGQLNPSVALAAQLVPSTPMTGIQNSFATTTQMIAYCVQDNAWNVTRGVYPSDPVGCFSASNMSTMPKIDTALANTSLRLSDTALADHKKYGYWLSEDITEAACFRSLLSTNINTLVTNQFSPETSPDVSWDKPSYIKWLTVPRRNSSGYYYYANTTATAPTTFTTPMTPIRKILTTPPNNGTKTVMSDGENIQINANIVYSGLDKMLVIIARKNSKWAGWNIFIDPSVTRIDAILIAEGGVYNAVNGVIKHSFDPTNILLLSNRLTLNGRLYSFNTRGGSLVPSGSSVMPATGSLGKYFQNNALLATNTTTLPWAHAQDLERFRMIIADGNNQCSFHVNYTLFNNTSIPPILQRPLNFVGGACSF